jgi:hypothetical protein
MYRPDAIGWRVAGQPRPERQNAKMLPDWSLDLHVTSPHDRKAGNVKSVRRRLSWSLTERFASSTEHFA